MLRGVHREHLDTPITIQVERNGQMFDASTFARVSGAYVTFFPKPAGAKPSLDIVAAEDDTEVTISPTSAIVGGVGVAATGRGQPQTYVINKGQVLQITQDDELTGSPIQANKPIALWGAAAASTSIRTPAVATLRTSRSRR